MPLHSPRRIETTLGATAAAIFICAVLGFGAALDGYLQALHPVALLGARGMPHALAFNVLGWALPGVLAVAVAVHLLRRLPVGSHWVQRVAGQLLVLAGMAFTGMGLLPLDVADLDGPASQAHASAWMVWVLAFIAGTLMLGIGSRKTLPPLARLALSCGLVAGMSAFALQGLVPAPIAQRVTFLAWAIWLGLALPMMGRSSPQR